LRTQLVFTYSRDDAEHNAERLQAMWGDVRFFNRDGSKLMRDGIPEDAAFRRRLGL
jgi:hypothetical protein